MKPDGGTVNPIPKRWHDPWTEAQPTYRPTTAEVHKTDPTLRTLLGPKGEVLKTFSDQPPIGFHQGQRGDRK